MGTARIFVVLVVALAVVGWSATGSAALPSAEQLAPSVAARVSDVPKGLGTITRAEFRRALAQAAAADGRRRVPRHSSRGYGKLARTAVDALLEGVWIKGQAAEMHIAVTRKQVLRKLVSLKRESFKSAAEYRKFLREARYTRRDVHERVELQLLSARIQRRIEKRIRSKSEEQKVFREFVAQFTQKWRARTVCAPAYVTSRCTNGPQS